MSGGAGSRLWPLSRQAAPKQLHALLGERSLLRETLDRLASAPQVFGQPVVVCNATHEQAVRAQFDGLDPAPRLILEPVGRNTAACAAIAAGWAAERIGREALVLLAPADHLIASAGAFAGAVSRAVPAAREGQLVTLGVRPTHPETGYGYIRLGPPLGGIFEAAEFVEKPDAATAERYLAHGGYLWNAGYFLFRADRMLEEMARLQPEIAARAAEALRLGRATEGAVALDAEAFAAAPSDSVDYAVMEKTGRVAVAPLETGWSDVGSWAAVWEALAKDGAGNALSGDVLALDASGCLIRSEGPTVAVCGARDLVVIATGDAVLVVPRDQSQRVKAVVEQLKGRGRGDLL
jgi:mannose-1-phosphate guanylyltransferase/mannose-1-phosphate guanylyltransferase/mannose-6-phosphate isomerase